jgi:probable blue pigment (indigoidine) exporter
MSNLRAADSLLTALAPLAWGTTYIVTTELLPKGVPVLSAAVRALPAGLILLALFRKLPEGVWRWRVLLLGALNIGVVLFLIFFAAQRLPGGIAATIGAAQPLIVAVLGWGVLARRPSLRLIFAGALGLAGIALLVLHSAIGLDPLGVAAALGATCATALGAVLLERWGRPAPLMLFTAWQLVAGGILLLGVGLVFEPLPHVVTARNVLGFAWVGIVNTAFAYALWFRGVERLNASATAFLSLLSPITAVGLGFLIKSERMSVIQVAGVLLVAAAVVYSQRISRQVAPAM